MKLRLKRSLYLAHRWFGIAMCVLFAMWFSTGIIMMYVEYPELTEEERLAKLAPLDFDGVGLSADEAITASGLDGDVVTITLSAIGARAASPVGRLAVTGREAEARLHALVQLERRRSG